MGATPLTFQDMILTLEHYWAEKGCKKASSSGAIKPPMAEELLEFYTPEELLPYAPAARGACTRRQHHQ